MIRVWKHSESLTNESRKCPLLIPSRLQAATLTSRLQASVHLEQAYWLWQVKKLKVGITADRRSPKWGVNSKSGQNLQNGAGSLRVKTFTIGSGFSQLLLTYISKQHFILFFFSSLSKIKYAV